MPFSWPGVGFSFLFFLPHPIHTLTLVFRRSENGSRGLTPCLEGHTGPTFGYQTNSEKEMCSYHWTSTGHSITNKWDTGPGDASLHARRLPKHWNNHGRRRRRRQDALQQQLRLVFLSIPLKLVPSSKAASQGWWQMLQYQSCVPSWRWTSLLFPKASALSCRMCFGKCKIQ